MIHALLQTKKTGIDSPKPSMMLYDCRARSIAIPCGRSGASWCEIMCVSAANIAADASTCSSA